ncbi:uncharacterized protein [Aegilops tauschii subsp. strangulata]|uniref:uncharacterized protein n=1 Tax=Aegilops tauschii subsp. strangulata TaxID=200361 RepID=UPI003CC87909
MEGLRDKLHAISGNLGRWNKETFGLVQKEIKALTAELERLRSEPTRVGPTLAELKVNEKLVEWYHREELMWRQRSRIEWLSAGDRNTRFFHLRESMRRKKNMIKALANSPGAIIDDPAELRVMVADFYKNLYTSEGVSDMDRVLQHVPDKSPGPDGFPAHFYQRHWDLCRDEVTNVVLIIVRGEESAESVNDTVLVVIPKVIANRLKSILPDIISEEQSAFVPGRLITDNIICAYECLHFMKRSRAKSNSFCALKLDTMKAYDRLEWSYLQAIMIKLGFSQHWFNGENKGCPQALRHNMKNIINVQNETLNERYLGMPTDVGQSKMGTFRYLRDRVWEKVKGWMEKLLSAAGKEVLIKAVAQALLVFSMACFRLPRGLCENIMSIIRQFWWGSKAGKRKPSWVAWDVMTRPKHLGGLGFRDMEIFNLALLGQA